MTFLSVIAVVADFVTIACGIELAIALIVKAVRYFKNHNN